MCRLSILLLAVAASAGAAERPARETVTTRVRPEVDPLGVRLGSWNLDASAALGYLHDDNIFATDTNEVDDDILLIEPELLLASGWSRHSLRLGAEAEIGRYNDNGDEDYDDSRLYVDGRIDLPSGDLTGGSAGRTSTRSAPRPTTSADSSRRHTR